MDGILIVDKPKGLTSHDVVEFVRRKFRIKKVGHAGTLDPMATGVLVMLLGKATKASNALMAHDKEYEGQMILGQTSDTGDAWGKVTNVADSVDLSRASIEDAFSGFVGHIEQKPPMYSAVKSGGKKLYELARKGISVDVKPRKIFIESLEVSNVSLPAVDFKVRCSKGTYIRQLCVDIGTKLGPGALLSSLKRTRSGDFSITQALGLDELDNMEASQLSARLLPVKT